MPLLVTALYLVAALVGASFALAEFRLLLRFVRHRKEVREAVSSRVAKPLTAGVGGGTHKGWEAPTVTVQLPLYNERLAARDLILAVAAQEYPRDRFDIQVLDDSTDETTEVVREAVADVRRRGVRIEHIRREVRTGYKAGALAHGLERSGAEYVALFDADFRPGPEFLHRVLVQEDAFSDPSVAFVQTRWSLAHSVRGIFHSALALLLDRHFYIQKPTRVFVGQVTMFNGSAGIWRRAAIEAAGGWSADTLTEDLDLSYRCALEGLRGVYLHDVTVPNELPEHMRSFKIQQRRWARGNAQCFRKLSGRVLDSRNPLRDRWEEAFLLAGYGIHPVILANLLLWPWAVLYVDRTFFWIMQGIMSLATLVAPVSFLITLRERGEPSWMDALGQAMAGLCLGMGLMVNNTVGQIQGFLSGKGAFVRTPKGWMSRGVGAAGVLRPYATPLHWTFFAELLVMAYCLVTGAMLIAAGDALWAFPLFFWCGCLGLVVHLQMTPQTQPA